MPRHLDSKGNPCDCGLNYSDSPALYVERHRNKEPNFNDQIAETIKKSNRTRLL